MKKKIEEHTSGKVLDCDDILVIIDEIDNACTSSLDILNDLLTYEKVDTGVLILDKDVVSAFPIVNDCIRSFLLQVNHHKNNINININK